MRLSATLLAAIRGANMVTLFPGKGAGGIARQMVVRRRFLLGETP